MRARCWPWTRPRRSSWLIRSSPAACRCARPKLVAKTAKEAESASAPRKKANGVSRDLTRLEEALSDHLGTRVALKVGAKDKGQIVIDFHGWEHLNSLLERQGLSGVVDA